MLKRKKQHIDEFEKFESTVLCHEIDHLDGILHIDIADKIIKGTKEERIEFRKKDGYTIISKTGEFEMKKMSENSLNLNCEKPIYRKLLKTTENTHF